MKTLKIVLTAVVTVTLAACIVKDTRHTLYLEPDGAVVWTVLEEDVRSSEGDPAEREREECDWLAAARVGDHATARGLAWLGGLPEARVLRSERPFAVWTEARFGSLEDLLRRIVDGLRLPVELETAIGPEGGTVVLSLDLAAADDSAEAEEVLVDLLDDLEGARIVLVEGEFTGAEGFELDGDRRVARPEPIPEELLEATEGTLRWSLAWTTVPAPAVDSSPGTGEPPIVENQDSTTQRHEDTKDDLRADPSLMEGRARAAEPLPWWCSPCTRPIAQCAAPFVSLCLRVKTCGHECTTIELGAAQKRGRVS